MAGKKYRCEVIEKTWITPSVIRLRFRPEKPFKYDPGQFISLVVPMPDGKSKPVKRAYSLASPWETAQTFGYELCVKFNPGGMGSFFLASLRPGDHFEVFAPYGHFHLKESNNRGVCFICTGTGIAPIRSMILSDQFQNHLPEVRLCIFGARTENELIFPGTFEKLHVPTIYAISKPSHPQFEGFRGRVTDYLKTLPREWPWHSTDFYICGNASMILEAASILKDGHGVPEKNIHQELYNKPTPATVIRSVESVTSEKLKKWKKAAA